MRILHVEKFLRRDRGGASAYMLDLVDRQRAAGHDVEMFGMVDPENVPSSLARFHVPEMQLDPPPPGLLARVSTAGRMIWNRTAARSMEGALESFRPEIVHCHNVYHQLTPAAFEPVVRRSIPIVMTVHDYKLVCPTYHLIDARGRDCDACVDGSALPVLTKRCQESSLARSAVLFVEAEVHRRRSSYDAVDEFLCPSRFMMAMLERGGIDTARLVHLPNATAPSKAPDPRPEPLRLVCVGQLIHRKGIDVAIDAIASIPDAHLVVCGSGPGEAGLRRQAEQRAPGRVEFTGHLSAAEIDSQLRRADALLLPSRGRENQPLVVLEAFAQCVPVIASESPPLRELIDEGVEGMLVPGDDAPALANAIRWLCGERDRQRAAGHAARRRFERDHRPDVHLQRVMERYDRVVARTAAGMQS